MTVELPPDTTLRFTKFLAYGWSSRRSLPSVRDQVDAAVSSAKRTGWEALLAEAARVPRRLLAQRRRRDRGRRRAPAGRPLRAVPHAAGGRAGGAPSDPRQGPDRPRLRRPRVLGHRDLRAPGAHLHAPAGRRRRAAMAPRDARPRLRARRDPRAQGRRVPVADDPRPGVQRLLARRDRRRSTSTPTSPTPSSATSAPPATASSPPGPGLELLVHTARLWRSLGHHDHEGRFHIDGVTGPDEYSSIADDNVYTNLMAEQNLRIAAELAGHLTERAQRARRRRRGDRRLARRRRRHLHPLRRAAAGPPAGRGLHPPRGAATSKA